MLPQLSNLLLLLLDALMTANAVYDKPPKSKTVHTDVVISFMEETLQGRHEASKCYSATNTSSHLLKQTVHESQTCSFY